MLVLNVFVKQSAFSLLFLALSVLLWPLVVYHELIQRMYTALEPILMKLDYSMKGETEHRKHDKRSERLVYSVLCGINYKFYVLLWTRANASLCFRLGRAKGVCVSTEVKKELEEGDEPQEDTDSESEDEEEELSCFAPTVRTHA